jgi:methyl-accepting chemotaxis protein
MNNWNIGKRITASFAMVIAITVVLGAYAYSRILNIEQSKAAVAEVYLPAILSLSHIKGNAYLAEDQIIDESSSSDPQAMDRMDAKVTDLRETNKKSLEIYEAIPSDEQQTALYATVKDERAKFWTDLEQVQKANRIGTPAGNKLARDTIDHDLRPQMGKFAAATQALVDFDMKGSQDGLALIEGAVKSSMRGILIGIAVAIACAIPITMWVVRSITLPIGLAVDVLEKMGDCDLSVTLDVHSGDEIGKMAIALNTALERLRTTLHEVTMSATSANASSQELSAAAESIASGAQEQAASLEETSASLEEITATIRQSADNARQASQLAASSRESAEKGQGVVTNAISAMEEINVASAKISDIISTIDEIAFQTNLLAVNAAVEAARAGEEGRGFAVVASEVRSLAQRSAGAAKEIKGLIQDSLRKVEKGSELVNRSGETLHSIVSSVKRVTDIVGEIAAAAEEQSTGVDQVNTAVTQIDQVTQSNSAQTEELSSTAQALSDQSARLLKLVSIFTLEHGGRESMARSEPARRLVPQAARPAKRQTSLTRKAAPQADFHGQGSKLQVPAALLSSRAQGNAAADSSFEEF